MEPARILIGHLVSLTIRMKRDSVYYLKRTFWVIYYMRDYTALL